MRQQRTAPDKVKTACHRQLAEIRIRNYRVYLEIAFAEVQCTLAELRSRDFSVRKSCSQKPENSPISAREIQYRFYRSRAIRFLESSFDATQGGEAH
jgi:hypothetical protein